MVIEVDPRFIESFYGHLSNLVDLGSKLWRMGVFLHDPIGHRIKLIESGTRMSIKIQNFVLTTPKLLHSRQTFKNQPDIAFQGRMYSINGIHDMLRLTGLIYTNYSAWPFRLSVIIKPQEYIGARAFTPGETVKDCQQRILCEWSQFFEEIAGRSIKTYIYDGLPLRLRSLDEVKAEYRRQTAGVVVPNHVIPIYSPPIRRSN